MARSVGTTPVDQLTDRQLWQRIFSELGRLRTAIEERSGVHTQKVLLRTLWAQLEEAQQRGQLLLPLMEVGDAVVLGLTIAESFSKPLAE
jgi:hypothetical protein